MVRMTDLRDYREQIRRCIGGVLFASPIALTIQLMPKGEVNAQRVVDRFVKNYKRFTGTRKKGTNLIGVLEKTGHYHVHFIADRTHEWAEFESRVWSAIKKTKGVFWNGNHLERVTDSGWAAYITKFRDGKEEIAVWETA